uniref:Uncharacterized protein n=1 Tax=viral metagenome TaxID=1070528 RepID=A0A6C0F0M3_9ZZZZ
MAGILYNTLLYYCFNFVLKNAHSKNVQIRYSLNILYCQQHKFLGKLIYDFNVLKLAHFTLKQIL